MLDMMTCYLADVHRSFREACPFLSQSRNSSLRVGAVVTSQTEERGTALKAGSLRVRFPMVSLEVFIFRPHYSSGVDSVSNRNDYQEYFSGGKSSFKT